jgi:hypothetical protein
MAAEALVPVDQRAGLLALGDRLPPVHYAGFETGLGHEPSVDLQQGIDLKVRTAGDLDTWCTEGPTSAVGRLLSGFLALWRTSPDVQATFRQLWLELDRGIVESTPPSLFLTIEPNASAQRSAALQAVHRWLRARYDEEPESVAQETAPAPTHVGYLIRDGRMRQRMIEPLARPGDLPALVASEPERRAARFLVEQLDPLESLIPEFRLCRNADSIDAGGMSVEAFFPREADALDRLFLTLEREHWAPADQLDGLRDWPGILTPENHAGNWPGSLLLDSLRQTENTLSVIERRLGHLKITVAPDGARQCKVYFGYRPRWLVSARS